MSGQFRISIGAFCTLISGLAAWAGSPAIMSGYTVVGNAIPNPDTLINVLEEHLTITIEKPRNVDVPFARVLSEYTLHNPTDHPQRLTLSFPVVGPEMLPDYARNSSRAASQPAPWFSVWHEGRFVTLHEETFVANLEPEEYQIQRRRRYQKLLTDWIGDHPKLSEALSQYHLLSVPDREYHGKNEVLEKEISGLLMNRDLKYVVRKFVEGETSFNGVYQLIPEIDPAWRVEIPDNGNKYVSLLPDRLKERCKPFEEQWRRQIADWIDSKPALLKKAEAVRDVRARIEKARAFRQTEIDPYLRNHFDLIDSEIDGLISFDRVIKRPDPSTEYRPNFRVIEPPLKVMIRLFPEVRKEIETIDKTVRDRHIAWGIDRRFMSPFTGRLYRPGKRPMRVEAVRALLTDTDPQPPPQSFIDFNEPDWWHLQSQSPRLLIYQVELAPGARNNLVVLYSQLMEFDWSLYVSTPGAPLPHLTYIFKTPKYWNGCETINVRVLMPRECRAVILPPPDKLSVTSEAMVYETTLMNPETNLHIAVVSNDPDQFFWPLPQFKADDKALALFQNLLSKTTHPMIRNVLRAAIAPQAIRADKRLLAWHILRDLEAEDPDSNWEKSILSSSGAEEIKQELNWINVKIKSPKVFFGYSFPHLNESRYFVYHGFGRTLSTDQLAYLGQKVAENISSYQNYQEQMGARFILAAAQIEPQKQLGEFLGLIKAHPELTHQALKILEVWPGDKNQALTFVLDNIDPNWKSSYGGTIHTAAVAALRTFTVDDAVPRMLALMHRTNNSSVLDAAMQALSNRPAVLPFEDLAAMEDKLAAHWRYLKIVAQSDPVRAIPFFHKLMEKHPQQSPQIMDKLIELKDSSVIPLAIDIYNKSSEENAIHGAARVLSRLADPSIFHEIHYRAGLKEGANASLVQLVSEHGGDGAAFEFVEKYYLEHLKGKKPKDSYDIVGAFEKIADPRALPYLHEMMLTLERKMDAAQALGTILVAEKLKASAPLR